MVLVYPYHLSSALSLFLVLGQKWTKFGTKQVKSLVFEVHTQKPLSLSFGLDLGLAMALQWPSPLPPLASPSYQKP